MIIWLFFIKIFFFICKIESNNEDGYETSDSLDDDEVQMDEDDDDMMGERDNKNNTEHSNPDSLAWAIIRLAVISHITEQLSEFLQVAGIEPQDLALASPLTHKIFQTIHTWQKNLKNTLEAHGVPPSTFISNCFVDNEAKGAPIRKYASLLQSCNSPFSNHISAAFPARRLWSFLVKQESLQEIFIRAIFGKSHSNSLLSNDLNSFRIEDANDLYNVEEPIRIIHKDQESITAFCINKTEPGLLVLATPKELQEIDASLLLQSNQWLEDECELDLLNLNKDVDNIAQSSYLIVRTPYDP